MLIGAEFLRPPRADEEDAIDALLTAAFGGPDEARLVRQLRSSGAMAGEQVLPVNGVPAGYFALSRMQRPNGWLCLAPVAVDPALQRRGIGRRMMTLLTAWAREAGQVVVVLGQPEFYGTVGFDRDRAARLRSPYPLDHTLLAGPGTDSPAETLVYPAAFGVP